MKPHKHAELIKAWADGAEIQYFSICANDWITCNSGGFYWYERVQYRIKPEPKPVDEVGYTHIRYNFYVGDWYVDDNKIDNLKLTFDGETGELKSAEVLK